MPKSVTPQDITDQYGLYANMRLTFWDRWLLTAGVRASWYSDRTHSDFYDPTSGVLLSQSSEYRNSSRDVSWPPVYSLSFDISKQLTVYGSYTDIYDPQTWGVDHSLRPIGPITGTNIEGGLKWSGRGGKLNASLSVYRLVEHNFAVFLDYGNYASSYGDVGDGLHYCCYANASGAQNQEFSEGADLEVSGEILPGWQISGSYTYNDNEQRGSDNPTRGRGSSRKRRRICSSSGAATLSSMARSGIA